MGLPKTGSRKDCVVSVEFDPVAAPGVFTKWCGAKGFSLSIANEFSEEKVGDCDDWSLPIVTVSAPSGMTISANMDATWTGAFHAKTSDWALNQKKLNILVEFPFSIVDEVESYAFEAYIEGLDLANIASTENALISESISLKVSGAMVPTIKV